MEYSGLLSLIVFLLTGGAVLTLSFYIYVFFSHEYEINFKGIRFIIVSIVLSIYCTFFTVLLVVFDYINAAYFNIDSGSNSNSFLDIELIWMISLVFSCFLFANNIFWIVYYRYYNLFSLNKNDYEIPKRIKLGILTVLKVVGIVFVLIIPLTFYKGGKTSISIPMQTYMPDQLVFSINQQEPDFSTQKQKKTYIEIMPTIIIIIAAPFVLLGSFIFYFIGAFGMAAIPANFFTLWFRRPKKPDADDMVMCDMVLTEETVENVEKLKDLIEIEEEINEMKENPDVDVDALKRKIETFEKEVITVQKKLIIYEDMRATKQRQHNFLEENPLKYFSSLILGILTSALSIIIFLHTLLTFVNNYDVLENIFKFLRSFNIIYLQIGYLLIAFYLLLCCLKGYEKISYLFPNQIGFNQMQPNRTWIDTWLIMCCFLIPSSWAVISFFFRLCPNVFNKMYGSRIMKIFILKVYYIKMFYDFELFVGFMFFSFIIGIIVNFSAGMTTEELNRRVNDTRENMKGNQLKYQMDMKGFRT